MSNAKQPRSSVPIWPLLYLAASILFGGFVASQTQAYFHSGAPYLERPYLIVGAAGAVIGVLSIILAFFRRSTMASPRATIVALAFGTLIFAVLIANLANGGGGGAEFQTDVRPLT